MTLKIVNEQIAAERLHPQASTNRFTPPEAKPEAEPKAKPKKKA